MVAGKKSSAQRVKGKHVAAVKKASAKPTAPASTSNVATIDRRESRDRRAEKERRVHSVPVAEERRVLDPDTRRASTEPAPARPKTAQPEQARRGRLRWSTPAEHSPEAGAKVSAIAAVAAVRRAGRSCSTPAPCVSRATIPTQPARGSAGRFQARRSPAWCLPAR